MEKFKLSLTTRAKIYAIILAIGPIVSFYGLATHEEFLLWAGLGGTILGVPGSSLALRNLTPDKEKEQGDPLEADNPDDTE